jgi:hypothetical protein
VADLAIVLQATAENPIVGDLALDGNDFYITDGVQAVMQDIRIRTLFVWGEWFLDRTQGVPYFQHILVAHPDLNRIRAIFRKVILGTPGMGTLDTFTVDFDRPNRVLNVAFAGRTADGTPINSADYGPFVVNV